MPDPSLLGDRLEKLLQVEKFPPPVGFAARSVVSDPDRYVQTYFDRFGPRVYFAGDGARRDENGYFWIIGRVDDVINVSGHRLSAAEIESALVSHPTVRTPCLVSAGKRRVGPTRRHVERQIKEVT